MTKPASYNHEFYSGDDKDILLRLKDSDGNVVDITGAVAKMQWRESRSSPEFVLEKDGTVDGPLGEILFQFTGEEVSEVLGDATKVANLVYDVELDEAGATRTIIDGFISIYRDVTR